MAREPLSTDRLVRTSRALLVEGGPDAVVVREVARRLGVTAPALYRHVDGRDDLLTLLITACSDEVTAVCAQALSDCPPDDPAARLRAATWAFRTWSLTHPPEFALVYGSPVVGYEAPPEGPTVDSAYRFGGLFGSLFADLLRAGRLRTVPDDELPPRLREDLRAAARSLGLPMRPGEVHPFVMGYQRMLGIVSVEVFGHLRWAFSDSEPFVRQQLAELEADLVLPAAP
ncbi:TetR/AcrR family transcriptional regulator [Jannaschia sp. R86511]|uniref:TetR/AcrR family transcriptional regulator n=1 Tax=Jannaschia sp. R86511 TaxID=3093853 RepID=UPI0036D2908C